MATIKKTETLQEKLNYIQTTLNAPKNLYNSFGKYSYRNLEGILSGIKPLLKETGCTFTLSDTMVEVGGRVYVEAEATIHFADDSLSVRGYAREEENKKGMDSSQLTGSTSSYARKYAANGLFAIDDTIDADGYNTHDKEVVKPSKESKPSTKATISNIEAVKNMMEKDKDATIKLLKDKYIVTPEQMKELGLTDKDIK
jgi:hypothetical protein